MCGFFGSTACIREGHFGSIAMASSLGFNLDVDGTLHDAHVQSWGLRQNPRLKGVKTPCHSRFGSES